MAPYRDANTNGVDVKTPLGQIVAIINALIRMGVLAAIAAYLVYRGAETIPGMQTQIAALHAAVDAETALVRENKAATERLTRAVEQFCVVLAATKSGADVKTCYEK